MKKLLFFVTEDWYFVSHRLDLALAAKNKGYNVTIVTQVSEFEDLIKSSGLNLIPINISRRSLNPITELKFLIKLYKIYKNVAPDIVHNVTLKPVIYGTIVSRFLSISKVINALAGLGFLFRSQSLKAKCLKFLVRAALKIVLKSKRCELILQNPDDLSVLLGLGVNKQQTHLIRGAGVNTDIYKPIESSPTVLPIVLIATRMLWDKGVGVFVDAAKIVNSRGIKATFVLVGEGDEGNLNSISKQQLETWNELEFVEWWGKCSGMPQVLNSASIVSLPSNYGEGIPKVLIEAASCGKPIITTDTPGCREIVNNKVNGFLIDVNNAEQLADKVIQLINSPELGVKMGQEGRKMVCNHFSSEKVIEHTLSVYKK